MYGCDSIAAVTPVKLNIGNDESGSKRATYTSLNIPTSKLIMDDNDRYMLHICYHHLMHMQIEAHFVFHYHCFHLPFFEWHNLKVKGRGFGTTSGFTSPHRPQEKLAEVQK